MVSKRHPVLSDQNSRGQSVSADKKSRGYSVSADQTSSDHSASEDRPKRAQDISRELKAAPFERLDDLIATYADDTRRQVMHSVEIARRRYEKEALERARVSAMYELQQELAGNGLAMGIDEVGRGAIAGPLTVCAVVLPDEPRIWGLNDSKQLSPKIREELAAYIEGCAVAIGISHVEPASIDALGMSWALRYAMRAAIEDAGIEVDAVLIDGAPVHVHERERCIVGGDARVACIAAASIYAKVTRDMLMEDLAKRWPEYHLERSRGYGTQEHIDAIRSYGLTPIHRVSFCGHFIDTSSFD